MPTTADHYHIRWHRYGPWLYIGWIESLKLEERPLYHDDAKTVLMFPQSWIDYITIGFTPDSVMKKLRKRCEKLKNMQEDHDY